MMTISISMKQEKNLKRLLMKLKREEKVMSNDLLAINRSINVAANRSYHDDGKSYNSLTEERKCLRRRLADHRTMISRIELTLYVGYVKEEVTA